MRRHLALFLFLNLIFHTALVQAGVFDSLKTSKACRTAVNFTQNQLGISDQHLAEMAKKVSAINSKRLSGDSDITTPFGGGIDARNASTSIRKKFKEDDINWGSLNEIERTLDAQKPLSMSQRSELANYMKTAINHDEAGADATGGDKSLRNILTRRLNDIGKKISPPSNGSSGKDQKPQDGQGQGQQPPKDQKPQDGQGQQPPKDQKPQDGQGQGQQPKDQKPQEGQSQAQQPKDQKPQDGQGQGQQPKDQKPQDGQGQGQQPKDQKPQDGQGQGQQPKDQKPQEGQGQQPKDQKPQEGQSQAQQPDKPDSKVGGHERDSKEREEGRQNGGKDHRNTSEDYTNKKELSDIVLRNLYLAELRKYKSASQFRSGLQNFFNYLANFKDSFHGEILLRYQSLVSRLIEATQSDQSKYDTLTDFSQQLSKQFDAGNMAESYKLAVTVYRVLREIKQLDALENGEKELLTQLEGFIGQLSSDGDQTAAIMARKFFYSLPGQLSREAMRTRFGEGLMTAGTLANTQFYHQIRAGNLWSYRYMGLLRPFLNIKEKELYTLSRDYSMNGKPKPNAKGPQVIRETDDMTEMDNFVPDYSSVSELQWNIANGQQRYYARRSEKNEPKLSRKAIKKVSLLISDGSTSMNAGLRHITRNLLQASYVDFHMSELKTDADVIHQTGKNIASHIIHHFTFTGHPGPIETIRTRSEGARYMEALAHAPEQNLGGSTNVNRAIIFALEKIRDAKRANDGDLQWASILLISDGDDGAIDRAAFAKLREEIGADTEVYINVILIEGSNMQLKDLTRGYYNSAQSQDRPPEYSYKELDTELLHQIKQQASSLPKVEAYETRVSLTQSQLEQQNNLYQARKFLTQANRALNLIANNPTALSAQARLSEKLIQMFKLQRFARPDNSAKTIEKTGKILGVLDQAIEILNTSPIPRNTKEIILQKMILDLCEEKGLNPIHFDEAVAETQFSRHRMNVSRWLNVN